MGEQAASASEDARRTRLQEVTLEEGEVKRLGQPRQRRLPANSTCLVERRRQRQAWAGRQDFDCTARRRQGQGAEE